MLFISVRFISYSGLATRDSQILEEILPGRIKTVKGVNDKDGQHKRAWLYVERLSVNQKEA
jgi:hypothetical protein